MGHRRRAGGEGKELLTKRGGLGQDTGQETGIAKMAELHRERHLGEGQPSPWADRVYQSFPVIGRV